MVRGGYDGPTTEQTFFFWFFWCRAVCAPAPAVEVDQRGCGWQDGWNRHEWDQCADDLAASAAAVPESFSNISSICYLHLQWQPFV